MSTPSWPAHPVGPDPELLAPLVVACPAVAGLHGGRFGEVATYLPGRRIRGIRVSATAVEIHVVGRYPARMAEIAAQVRAALDSGAAGDVGSRPIHVTIGDLVLPGEPEPDDAVEFDDIGHTPSSPAPATPAGATAERPARAPTFPRPPSTTNDPRDNGAITARPPATRLDRAQQPSR